jgi:hypothetical protein
MATIADSSCVMIRQLSGQITGHLACYGVYQYIRCVWQIWLGSGAQGERRLICLNPLKKGSRVSVNENSTSSSFVQYAVVGSRRES